MMKILSVVLLFLLSASEAKEIRANVTAVSTQVTTGAYRFAVTLKSD